MSLAEIKDAVNALSPGELAELAAFIRQRDEAAWDRQIREDVAAGRLDHLAEEALEEYGAGRTKAFPPDEKPGNQ